MASLLQGFPQFDAESFTGARSRTYTLSHCGSDGILTMRSTLNAGATSGTADADAGSDASDSDVRALVQRLEALQAQQRSPQQPTPEVDALIASALAVHPSWRTHMAVLTRSALIRQKVLAAKSPPRLLPRCGLDSLKHQNVLLKRSECYSVPRAQRFPWTRPNGEIDRAEAQKRSTPGPGSYCKSVPRGTAFSADGGETFIFGANHVCPWKGALGRQINPVEVDLTTLAAAPRFSFPKNRRFAGDP